PIDVDLVVRLHGGVIPLWNVENRGTGNGRYLSRVPSATRPGGVCVRSGRAPPPAPPPGADPGPDPGAGPTQRARRLDAAGAARARRDRGDVGRRPAGCR